ncbi:glutamate-gated chloride channel isoform X2 [Eurytemora carolleeae]|uniref:glutamate-gated chloride channel isoform X2 n=1 Tax=Eurytemora carolleeae TaxID=1294199 RepID=UPI000C757EE1|nr:glutamate-gated chloride channel isoform X2 [Eurytemora carolleeae]|eukprot:XP_023333946.1 glutamate-gated chloride channel-like isoform X2 [Eurytemora affinis]
MVKVLLLYTTVYCTLIQPLWSSLTVSTCKEGVRGLCIPKDYQKYDLPSPYQTTFVTIGVNLKDIPKISDLDFSITIDTYFNVRWTDERLLTQINESQPIVRTMYEYEDEEGADGGLTAVNLNVLPHLWIPDIEILDLMSFETHKVLSRLEGVWIDRSGGILYGMASKITFICQMNFNAFPVDIQVCHFRVGSFNYPTQKITFLNEGIPEADDIKSVLDYGVDFNPLPRSKSSYMALGMNYSATGFEVVLTRKMSFYIITYYLPSGLFVVVSWISFLVNPEVVPGRMTMLVTLFLVLINIHNTIQTNSPKAEGFTAIKTWIIACIAFVFGALLEYSVILLLLKLEKIRSSYGSLKGLFNYPYVRSNQDSLKGVYEIINHNSYSILLVTPFKA